MKKRKSKEVKDSAILERMYNRFEHLDGIMFESAPGKFVMAYNLYDKPHYKVYTTLTEANIAVEHLRKLLSRQPVSH